MVKLKKFKVMEMGEVFNMKTVMVSGGFDPIHKGHVRMFKAAAKLGSLVVVVNNDNWLVKKKGYVFMPEADRKEIIEEFACVDKVVLTNHGVGCDDMSVCDSLMEIEPDVFANGGDRFSDNIPEKRVCENLDIELVFNVGGHKVRSSSDLVKLSNQNSI